MIKASPRRTNAKLPRAILQWLLLLGLWWGFPQPGIALLLEVTQPSGIWALEDSFPGARQVKMLPSGSTLLISKQSPWQRGSYYRIQDDDEFLQLGPEEYFQSPAITLIEWADRISACMPEEYIQIDIQVTGQTTRKFALTAVGPTYEPVIDAIKVHLAVHE